MRFSDEEIEHKIKAYEMELISLRYKLVLDKSLQVCIDYYEKMLNAFQELLEYRMSA